MPVLVFVYFLVLTRDAWHAYFAPDDLMNLYRSWSFPLGALIRANFLFFLNSDFFRPMGSDWYRSIYYFAGFNPLPFHAVNLAFLLANIWLTYCVARRLTGSREAAAFAALLVSYHSHFAYLYFNTGYVYDVLCYFFYFAAFLLYLQARQRHRPLTAWELAGCVVLYICALNSKELALTLPLAVVAYELLYEPIRDRRAVITLSAVAALFAVGRALSRNGLLEQAPYRPVFTLHRFLSTSRHFSGDLFFRERGVSSAVLIGLWVALFAIAWATRSRPLKFAWLFLMLAPIPLAFIEPRGAAQYYIPFFGWVLYAATAAVYLTKRYAFFLTALALLFWLSEGSARDRIPFVTVEGERLRSWVSAMHAACPTLRPGSRVLFLHDPIDPGLQDLTFLVRLSYRDDTIEVDRSEATHPPYACALDFVPHGSVPHGSSLVLVPLKSAAEQNTSHSNPH